MRSALGLTDPSLSLDHVARVEALLAGDPDASTGSLLEATEDHGISFKGGFGLWPPVMEAFGRAARSFED